MILSFRCADSQVLFQGGPGRRFKAIERVATRKLQMLHAAKALNDLALPLGNRLEALKGNRKASTASVSTISGGCVSDGLVRMQRMSKSSITTE